MPPSRFVPFADELEGRGLIERRRNPGDRRLYAVHLRRIADQQGLSPGVQPGFRTLGGGKP